MCDFQYLSSDDETQAHPNLSQDQDKKPENNNSIKG